ncbi:hypothetical protein PVAG01_03798 [Phlyctema vagabunda]|uniref:Uncharacterized protein n=1 Tax=Phlyctema vagabunda TaxID=108571 RepID=A0ABR4PME5_9HELO
MTSLKTRNATKDEHLSPSALRQERDHERVRCALASPESFDQGYSDIDFETFALMPKSSKLRDSGLWKYIFGLVTVLCFDFIFQAMPMPFHVDVKRVGSDSDRHPAAVDICDCGKSITEAEAKGCTYDELAIAWLPPPCRDEELTVEFHHAGPNKTLWPYFADQQATMPLTVEQVSLLADTGEPFYTTHNWYLVHCNYNWRKLLRTTTTGVVMDFRNNNEKHTINCGDLAVKYRQLPLESISTLVYNSFGYV